MGEYLLTKDRTRRNMPKKPRSWRPPRGPLRLPKSLVDMANARTQPTLNEDGELARDSKYVAGRSAVDMEKRCVCRIAPTNKQVERRNLCKAFYPEMKYVLVQTNPKEKKTARSFGTWIRRWRHMYGKWYYAQGVV
jgi:hypothetical protein